MEANWRVGIDRRLVEADWRVGIDRRLVGASLSDHRLAGASNLADGRGEGGRNLELELKCEPGLEREPKHEHELEFELELEPKLEPELGLNERSSLG